MNIAMSPEVHCSLVAPQKLGPIYNLTSSRCTYLLDKTVSALGVVLWVGFWVLVFFWFFQSADFITLCDVLLLL